MEYFNKSFYSFADFKVNYTLWIIIFDITVFVTLKNAFIYVMEIFFNIKSRNTAAFSIF